MTASSPRPKASVRRAVIRWVRFLLLGLLIFVGLPLLAWGIVGLVLRYQGQRELQTVLAELEQKDPAWSWESLQAGRPSVPPEQNVMELVQRIGQQVYPFGKPPQTWDSHHPDWREYFSSVPPNHRWIPSAVQVVRSDLQKYPEAIPIVRSLKNYPRGSVNITLETNPLATRLEFAHYWGGVRELLGFDTLLALEEGDFRRAAGNIQAMFQISRVIGDTPFLITSLIAWGGYRLGVEKLEHWLAQDSAPEQLEQVQRWLEDVHDALKSDLGWRSERASHHLLFVALERGQVSIQDILGHDIPHGDWYAYQWLRASAWYRLPREHAYYLRAMTRWLEEVVHRPVEERLAAARAFEESLQADPQASAAPLSGYFLRYTASRRLATAQLHTLTLIRCAQVGLACERYRLKHQRWPDRLSDLTPEFLPQVPLDPFTGQPLRLTRTADGIAIHSGAQQQEGVPPLQGAYKTAGLPEGVLLGFRLWNPERRRQPPLPAEAPMRPK
ncbi:MAG: hypothetical protein N3E46_04065 [Gemmataceae bacterium]|jgi:hypothetical protein|uniref:Uncharacterized protein n=1 Tax=Thermogemmata fonticola TaxID=2755323 RepID=A0A7V9AC46_9BACT|nr:hypothetical protein [Thermogemmata fonticola]MBA2226629.1 hypothetical protein [Thermogemmata fonticola]MCX8138838.1 hypothetical protein [Gemmataceae bacterium]